MAELKIELLEWSREQLVEEVLRLVQDCNFLGDQSAALLAEVERLRAAPAEGEALKELWFVDDLGGEPIVFYKMDDGAICITTADEAPEYIHETCPNGWSRWDGTRRTLTASDLEDDETPWARMAPGDEWWEGEMVPATAQQVAEFFAVRTTGCISAPVGSPND